MGSNRSQEASRPSITCHDASPSYRSTFTSDSVSSPINVEPIDRDLLIKFFYVHFHPAHPLLVPRQLFARQQYPEYLQWTVYFIGQRYVKHHSGNRNIEATVQRMLALDREETVSRVQAQVLYAIVLHSLHRPREALDSIKRASQIANSLGLSHPGFASRHAAALSVEEESIRRTWWELHTVETYLAALHRQPSLQTKVENSGPLLPSSEESYNTGTCDPDLPSLSDFDNRFFTQESRRYSTSCYRIEAIRIVLRVLELGEQDHAHTDNVQTVDCAIASWKYYLPDSRTNELEQIDPLLFQAHFFLHTASIFLHFPRSDLPPTVPSAAKIACVKGHTQSIPTLSQHAAKAIEASREISNLAASLSSTDSCSPFFICALILACIVQLAASTIHESIGAGTCLSQNRARVVLLLGVLTEMSQRWTVAQSALRPLKSIADTIFGTPRREATSILNQSLAQDGIGSDIDVHAGISWLDLFSIDDIMAGSRAAESGVVF